MRQGFFFLFFSPVSPLLLWRKTHNHTLMTHQDGVNKREERKMENGHWWEVYRKRWRVDAGRNVIIGQCEPRDEKATRGFTNKPADTVCTGNMQPSMWERGPLSSPQSQWETEEGGHTVGHIVVLNIQGFIWAMTLTRWAVYPVFLYF